MVVLQNCPIQCTNNNASQCISTVPFPISDYHALLISYTHPSIPSFSIFIIVILFDIYFFGNNTSSKCFHITENNIPCNPLANIFVSNPRNINPEIPLSEITFRTTCGYDSFSAELCLYTFTTRMELEQVSLTAEEQKPRMARRPNSFNWSSCFGIFSERKLYVKNQG